MALAQRGGRPAGAERADPHGWHPEPRRRFGPRWRSPSHRPVHCLGLCAGSGATSGGGPPRHGRRGHSSRDDSRRDRARAAGDLGAPARRARAALRTALRARHLERRPVRHRAGARGCGRPCRRAGRHPRRAGTGPHRICSAGSSWSASSRTSVPPLDSRTKPNKRSNGATPQCTGTRGRPGPSKRTSRSAMAGLSPISSSSGAASAAGRLAACARKPPAIVPMNVRRSMITEPTRTPRPGSARSPGSRRGTPRCPSP